MRICKIIGYLVSIILCIYLSLVMCKFYFPFIIAYFISQIVEPLIKIISNRTRLTRKTSSIIVLILLFSFLSILVSFILIKVVAETNYLTKDINFYIEKYITIINEFLDKFSFRNINIPEEVRKVVEDTSNELLKTILNYIKDFLSGVIMIITQTPIIFIYFIITILATYFITSDKFYILDRMEHHLSKKWVGKISSHTKEITESLASYIKAEIILSFITFIIVLTGLNIFYLLNLNIEFPILMAIVIAFVDALPILGAGSIMIPWSFILFINKDITLGFSIAGLYLFILVIKQLLEPKIVSNKIGIHPIFTLISMYTCFKFVGIIGLILGPIILIILKNVFQSSIEKGLLNSLDDLY